MNGSSIADCGLRIGESTRDVSRGVSPLPRAENHRAAANCAALDPGAGACRIAGIDVVLRERGHLQHHAAGDVGKTTRAQNGKHRKDRREHRGIGESRLQCATGSGRSREWPAFGNRASDHAARPRLSGGEESRALILLRHFASLEWQPCLRDIEQRPEFMDVRVAVGRQRDVGGNVQRCGGTF